MVKELNESKLLEQKELREQLIGRVDVLEKVKNLFLIPQTDLMTIGQVAKYYTTVYTNEEKEKYLKENNTELKDVIITTDTIKKLYQLHKSEIDNDGTWLKNYKNFLMGHNFTLEKSKGKTTIIFNSEEQLEVPNRGLRVFSKRAVLRIGMLLRDSIVAKEIRTQILNTFEKTSDEIKVQDINEEQKLMLEVGMAFASGNTTAIMIATTNMMGFKNRHIEKLEITNKALANGILEWEDRSRINFAVRKLAKSSHLQYGQLWNDLYKQLKNKYHIDLKARGKQPWLQYVEEKEWNCVIKSFSALCAYYKQEASDMFCDLEVQEVQ